TSAILNVRAAAPGSYSAELSDIHGRRLITHSFAGETTELDLSAWPSGAYLLRVISEGKNVNTSIIQKIR
ncbi:MAG TPA: T9SS type A sorting domain-containing protein, partial [Saprospiraceae bacterium]|nr:T9SS type A sorting domain-containing protein [Saprospiraceae bacterium]